MLLLPVRCQQLRRYVVAALVPNRFILCGRLWPSAGSPNERPEHTSTRRDSALDPAFTHDAQTFQQWTATHHPSRSVRSFDSTPYSLSFRKKRRKKKPNALVTHHASLIEFITAWHRNADAGETEYLIEHRFLRRRSCLGSCSTESESSSKLCVPKTATSDAYAIPLQHVSSPMESVCAYKRRPPSRTCIHPLTRGQSGVFVENGERSSVRDSSV